MASMTAPPFISKYDSQFRKAEAYPTLEEMPANVDVGFSAPAAAVAQKYQT